MSTRALTTNDIWAGWEHLFRPVDDLEAFSFQDLQLDLGILSADDKRCLALVEHTAPTLLPVTARNVTLEENTLRSLMAAVGDKAPQDQRFIRLRRLLEIIDAGNRLGRHQIRIPYLPAPLPPAPRSPFRHSNFEALPALDVTTQPIKSKWGNFPAKTNANASDALSPCFRQVDK